MEKILTKRLYLILSNPKLAKEVADFHIRNRQSFEWTEPTRYPEYYTKKGQRVYLKQDLKEAIKQNEFRFWLQVKGEKQIIGTVSIASIMQGSVKSCYLSYKLDKDYQKKGYMSEAVEEIINFAFRDLELHRIEAAVMPKNIDSINIMKRFNFEQEGYSKQYLEINGKREDHLRFALIKKSEK